MAEPTDGIYYFECTCGANFITIKPVTDDDWTYCPHCGRKIEEIKAYTCDKNCELAYTDDENQLCYCGSDQGLYRNCEVTDQVFNDCPGFILKPGSELIPWNN